MPKTEKMMVYMDAETVSLQINKLRGELLKIADILAGPTMIKEGDFLKKCFNRKKLSPKQSQDFVSCVNRIMITSVKAGLDAHKVVADLDRATRENQATNSSTTGH
jgi:hypothetical protein